MCGQSPSSSKLRHCSAPCKRRLAGPEHRKSTRCGRRETGRSSASEVPGTLLGHTAGRKAIEEKTKRRARRAESTRSAGSRLVLEFDETRILRQKRGRVKPRQRRSDRG